MTFKNFLALISLFLTIVLIPLSGLIGPISSLTYVGDTLDDPSINVNVSLDELDEHAEERRRLKEIEKMPIRALRNSWTEILDKSQFKKKQKIRAFRMPGDITGLTVLWGTWFTFEDSRGDKWNFNAPFSYTQYSRPGEKDISPTALKETQRLDNERRSKENVFDESSGLFLPGKGYNLPQAMRWGLKNLVKFEGFPGVQLRAWLIFRDHLLYVAKFNNNYLDNPAEYIHYQKLIAEPEDSGEVKNNGAPYLAGYEANKLFFNWHPKLRGIQLINTNPERNEFYQFSIDWNGWDDANAHRVEDETKYKVDPSRLTLLRAVLTVKALRNENEPYQGAMSLATNDDGTIKQVPAKYVSRDEYGKYGYSWSYALTNTIKDTDDEMYKDVRMANEMVTTDKNRLAILLLDHPEFDEVVGKQFERMDPAQIYSQAFKEGDWYATFYNDFFGHYSRDWWYSATGEDNVANAVPEKASINWMWRNIHVLNHNDLHYYVPPSPSVAPIAIGGTVLASSGVLGGGGFYLFRKFKPLKMRPKTL